MKELLFKALQNFFENDPRFQSSIEELELSSDNNRILIEFQEFVSDENRMLLMHKISNLIIINEIRCTIEYSTLQIIIE